MVLLHLFNENNIWIASTHFRKQQTEHSPGNAAAKEDCSLDSAMISRHQEGQSSIGNSLQRMAGMPTLLDRVLKADADMIAPAFPDAAEMPCANARYRVGKSSAG